MLSESRGVPLEASDPPKSDLSHPASTADTNERGRVRNASTLATILTA